MELFKICIEDLYWIDGSKDNPDDLCLHGKMYTVIGEQKLVHDGSVTVSASALYFLKTLTEDHIINKDNQMMPCCGHMIIPNEDGKTAIKKEFQMTAESSLALVSANVDDLNLGLVKRGTDIALSTDVSDAKVT